MMTEPQPQVQPQPQQAPPEKSKGPWPVLDIRERRVLGVLIEKGKTSTDAYPMTINALVTGCNQKSNRDPILNLTDDDIEETLERCVKKRYAQRVTTAGGRVERWRHILYDNWEVGNHEIAALAELLLRGPQTEGELRGRAGRMEDFADLDALRKTLRPLVERNLVVYLTAEDRRGAMLTHGFHDPRELDALRARVQGEPTRPESPVIASAAPPPVAAQPSAAHVESVVAGLERELKESRGEVEALRQTVAKLQAALDSLRGEFHTFKQSLGG